MKRAYLEITFRKGKAIAAYLYLPRPTGARATRTVEVEPTVLVDYAASGEPIGVELTSPQHATAEIVAEVLASIGADPVDPAELAPLAAA